MLFGLISALFTACTSDPLTVDTSSITIKTNFVNLDSILVHSNPDDLIKNHHVLQTSIGEIYEYQLGYILKIGRISDTAFVRSIQQFKTDKGIKELEKEIGKKFNNLDKQKQGIMDGLKHLKYHFPKGKMPSSVVFMNSLIQSNAFCTENEIGIGLDRYLGAKNKFIKKLPGEPFHDWIKEAMNADFLERDALCSWIMTHYMEEKEGNLAENIIRWGKILYLTEASFPTAEKNIIIRYSKEDYTWALENEFKFWEYLVKEGFLYKTNELDQANMLNEAPFTIGLPDESPDRFGQFIGWRMVQMYMSKNDVTLEELIKTPYNEIMQEYEIED